MPLRLLKMKTLSQEVLNLVEGPELYAKFKDIKSKTNDFIKSMRAKYNVIDPTKSMEPYLNDEEKQQWQNLKSAVSRSGRKGYGAGYYDTEKI